MNHIVREHYPVSNLPEDLREGFEGRTEVRITIDADESISPVARQAGPFSCFRHVRRTTYQTIEEAVAEVRALRDD